MATTTQPKDLIKEQLRSREPVVWLFVGDSITQGAVHTRGWRDYTQLFKERLGEMDRNEDVVINTAVGGWTLDGLANRMEERIFRFSPNVVFAMFGTNDAAGGAKGLERFASQYQKLLARAADAHITTIVQTALPIAPVDPDRFGELTYADANVRPGKIERLRTRQQFIEAYVKAAVAAASASGAQLVDHWSTWLKHRDTLGELCDGGFHPNEYGHRLIARTLFQALSMYDESSWTCRQFIPVHGD